MGVINFKVYIIIAIALFAILFAVQLLGAGPGTAGFFQTVQVNAANAGLGATVANFVIGPFVWTFNTYIYGPAVAALLWPVAIIWLLLFVIVWMFSLLAPGFSDIPT